MKVTNYNKEEVEVLEQPLTVRDVGGCKCDWTATTASERLGISGEWDTHKWIRNPDCAYHNTAEAQPWNHCIPWNCPAYWDGCNCDGGPYFPQTAAL